MTRKIRARRKLTQERADRINRQRELREGERSIEIDAQRVIVVDGRGVDLPAHGPGFPTERGRE
jgi:hypothetical protein